jgi:Ser/Thr protein kinase RdoA (MazF antagonist)
VTTEALAQWNLQHATATPLSGGTANQNYLVVHGPDRYFLRRRSPRYIDPAQITFDHALMRRTAEAGLIGPNPLPTVEGDTVARVGEAVYELHRFIEGMPADWTSLEHLREAARTLRRFHEATSAFNPPMPKDWPRDDAPERIRRGLDELRTVLSDPETRAILDRLADRTDRIESALPDAAYWSLPTQIVHGDFHPGNVLVTPQGLGLFDFDCASRQPRIRDLADGILYFCARRDGPFDASTITRLTRECELDSARNRIFLEAYGPLAPEELNALPWVIAARWIYSRVHGRRKLPRYEWPRYATEGILTPLNQLESSVPWL